VRCHEPAPLARNGWNGQQDYINQGRECLSSESDISGCVVAVCRSEGGIPKRPLATAQVTEAGIIGDAHHHAKHNRSARALSLLDEEILSELRLEGYELAAGDIGENVLLRGVSVQRMLPGTILKFGDVIVRLEEPRKPCYVLDAIDSNLKHIIAGRCGYMASVVQGGIMKPGDIVLVCGAASLQ
jgi:MOSC domain-containing protein YiiM